MKRILIAAGGTGGHVFPGLAFARYLREQGVEVQWLGTSQGLEARVVPQAGFPLATISITGLRGKGARTWMMAPWRVTHAVMEARRVIQSVKPDMVLGMGGFVSGPAGLAAVMSRCPLLIHEQNAIPGLTNRLLAPLATRVLQGFPDVFRKKRHVVTVGNPVRSEILQLPSLEQRLQSRQGPLNILVLGGSQGAQVLNKLIPNMFAALAPEIRPHIWHQTGEKHFAETQALYPRDAVKVSPFIDNMNEAYAFADLVICRAGALTLAEICAVGVPAILVPLPYAAGDHQTANAAYLASRKAAILLPQCDFTVERLCHLIEVFTRDRMSLQTMAKQAYALRVVNTVEQMFNTCQEVLH